MRLLPLSLLIGWSGFSAVAPAQAAWDYLELMRSSPSRETSDRWYDVGTGCESEPEQRCLSFRLPRDLIGDHEREIVLRGASAPGQLLWTLVGDHAEAACARGDSGSSCIVVFKELGIQPHVVDAYLDATYADPAERLRRGRAAASFFMAPSLRYWHGFR